MKMIPGATSLQDLCNSALNLFPLIHMIFPGFSIASHMFLNKTMVAPNFPIKCYECYFPECPTEKNS
jgi:molybdopterin/thiamine biosynthesis adenylyltransferase